MRQHGGTVSKLAISHRTETRVSRALLGKWLDWCVFVYLTRSSYLYTLVFIRLQRSHLRDLATPTMFTSALVNREFHEMFDTGFEMLSRYI